MFCEKCGREISEESQFCPYCGAKISRPDESDAALKKSSSKEAAGGAASEGPAGGAAFEEPAGGAAQEAPGSASSGTGKNGKRGPGKGVLIGILCAAAAAAFIVCAIFRNTGGGGAGAEAEEAKVSVSSRISSSSAAASPAEVHASSVTPQPITPTPTDASARASQPITPKPTDSAARASQPITPTPADSSARASQPITPTPTDSSAAGGGHGTEAQGASSVSAGTVTQVTASSTLVQSPYSYAPENITDGDRSTAWVEGAGGNGIGENVTLTYDGTYFMQGFRIRNGYQKKSDLYTKNARPKTIELIFSDGSAQEFGLADSGLTEQEIRLSAPVNSSSVTLVIRDVYPGTKYEDTAITEFGMY